MNRSIARISSALFALCFALLCVPRIAVAAPLWQFAGRTFAFTHVEQRDSTLLVGIDDPALRRLFHSLGAIVTWKPGARYVLVATGEPTIVSFAIGHRTYDIGPLAVRSKVAPFVRGGEAFLEFGALARSLGLRKIAGRAVTILQPQITSLDVRDEGNGMRVIARGAIPLQARLARASARQMTYAFVGLGTRLLHVRSVDAGGLVAVEISQVGTAANPTTYLTLDLDGSSHVAQVGSLDGRDIGFVIAPGASTLAAAAPVARAAPATRAAPAVTPSPTPQVAVALRPPPNAELPTVSPWNRVANEPLATSPPVAEVTPAPLSSLAQIDAIQAQLTPNGVTLHVALTGAASFDWHHLRAPDNRFWIDLHGATLEPSAIPPSTSAPIENVRARQIDPQTVRIALSIDGAHDISVTPAATGVDIAVNGTPSLADASTAGTGVAGTGTPSVTLAAAAPVAGGDPNLWSVNPVAAYVPTNPRLIVIDPGHGGSDRGAVRHGVAEAVLTLDMAKRLRAILEARGWQVIMTRTKDVDVYAPFDTAEQELQARDNIANRAGARLLVSIHANAYINAGPNGTTTYYAKPIDLPLARDIQNELAAQVGTKNDGIVKSHLYIPLHAFMPACLVETAFLSNPDDFALLTDPAWRQKVAVAIADGIADYAGAPPPAIQPQQ
ncbi:MAG: hypothetical protein HKL92_04930 [Candidatus Eremiobacteraeota bacterium]|nr:hypothetical protein [Candidatus Eremiobacteraeota bacterium]